MPKFNDIKKGDTVFSEVKVRYGWNKAETFFIPEKVHKVTKTQFTLENGKRARKENGKVIDGNYGEHVMKEGEKLIWGKGVVKDQAEEMKEFRKKINTETKINELASELKVEMNSELSTEDLEKVHALLKEVKEIIQS